MKFTTATATARNSFKESVMLKAFMAVFLGVWAWTFIGTPDVNNWFLENLLVFIFLGCLAISYRKFKFSDLTYTFIFVYLLLHIYGAKYTYAENPFGYWLQEQLGTERNHYDRIVHFSFGFMLAYPMRDLFWNYFEFPAWVCWILPVEITLSFSGAYELVEWGVADVLFPEQGTAYLGTQGDIWDAQKDMFLALCGSIIIMVITSTIKRQR